LISDFHKRPTKSRWLSDSAFAGKIDYLRWGSMN
jgi:hypothetical protein